MWLDTSQFSWVSGEIGGGVSRSIVCPSRSRRNACFRCHLQRESGWAQWRRHTNSSNMTSLQHSGNGSRLSDPKHHAVVIRKWNDDLRVALRMSDGGREQMTWTFGSGHGDFDLRRRVTVKVAAAISESAREGWDRAKHWEPAPLADRCGCFCPSDGCCGLWEAEPPGVLELQDTPLASPQPADDSLTRWTVLIGHKVQEQMWITFKLFMSDGAFDWIRRLQKRNGSLIHLI